MEKIKKLIIIIIVLLVIILISLIILKNINKKEIENPENVVIPEEEQSGELLPEYDEKGFSKVDDRAILFTITDCVQNYLDYINPENNIFRYNKDYTYTQEEIENARKDILYKFLSKNYINKNNITKENVKQYVDQINENTIFIPKEVISNFNYDLNIYIIMGNIINSNTYEEKIYIIKTDNKNLTFSIEPINNKNEIKTMEWESAETSIENKVYNIFEYNKGTTEETINKYINYCRKMIINNDEEFYNNYLESNYKQKRFITLQNFRDYKEKDIDKLRSIYIKKYEKSEYENYTEYICIDQYNNYYIFQEKSPMNYTVKLDTYTIDTQEFKERYSKEAKQQKVEMNLEKINQALNRKDYQYIYEKLDSIFKSNNFATLPEFENYIKNTFFSINQIEYGEFNSQANTYIYETKITDYTKETQDVIEKIFIIKLEEGEDFTISFNIE